MVRYSNLLPGELMLDVMMSLSVILCENGSYMRGEHSRGGEECG
jgi:hypothetical protein